jgi:hypothetical protein
MEPTKFSPDHEMFVQILQLSCSLENKIYVRVYIYFAMKFGKNIKQTLYFWIMKKNFNDSAT